MPLVAHDQSTALRHLTVATAADRASRVPYRIRAIKLRRYCWRQRQGRAAGKRYTKQAVCRARSRTPRRCRKTPNRASASGSSLLPFPPISKKSISAGPHRPARPRQRAPAVVGVQEIDQAGSAGARDRVTVSRSSEDEGTDDMTTSPGPVRVMTVGPGDLTRIEETLFTPLRKSIATDAWTRVILPFGVVHRRPPHRAAGRRWPGVMSAPARHGTAHRRSGCSGQG